MVQNLATWAIHSVLVLMLNMSAKGMCLLFFIDSKKQKVFLMAKQTESYVPDRKCVNWLLK
jgi:hypothetical protein